MTIMERTKAASASRAANTSMMRRPLSLIASIMMPPPFRSLCITGLLQMSNPQESVVDG
jgi:hypothetical protein